MKACTWSHKSIKMLSVCVLVSNMANLLNHYFCIVVGLKSALFPSFLSALEVIESSVRPGNEVMLNSCMHSSLKPRPCLTFCCLQYGSDRKLGRAWPFPGLLCHFPSMKWSLGRISLILLTGLALFGSFLNVLVNLKPPDMSPCQ